MAKDQLGGVAQKLLGGFSCHVPSFLRAFLRATHLDRLAPRSSRYARASLSYQTGIATELATHRQAVLGRQHDVEQNEIESLAEGDLDAFETVGSRHHIVPGRDQSVPNHDDHAA